MTCTQLMQVMIARHTSHVTRRTSHLTPHTSHLTPHTSHVTLHAPYFPAACSNRQLPAQQPPSAPRAPPLTRMSLARRCIVRVQVDTVCSGRRRCACAMCCARCIVSLHRRGAAAAPSRHPAQCCPHPRCSPGFHGPTVHPPLNTPPSTPPPPPHPPLNPLLRPRRAKRKSGGKNPNPHACDRLGRYTWSVADGSGSARASMGELGHGVCVADASRYKKL